MADTESNPLAEFWSLVHRRMAQEFSRVKFGSEMEASAGGSSASFRLSDSAQYVSQILAQHPVSFVERYPNEVNQLRVLHGLEPLEDPPIIPGMPTDEDTNTTPEGLKKLESYLPGAGFIGWLNQNLLNFQVFTFAIVLIIIGGIMIALSTDTGKAVAKDAVKAAAA